MAPLAAGVTEDRPRMTIDGILDMGVVLDAAPRRLALAKFPLTESTVYPRPHSRGLADATPAVGIVKYRRCLTGPSGRMYRIPRTERARCKRDNPLEVMRKAPGGFPADPAALHPASIASDRAGEAQGAFHPPQGECFSPGGVQDDTLPHRAGVGSASEGGKAKLAVGPG
ncbi:hypothetical protein BO71DRAFT_430518 [Aspergillus ellipticus CBS 707.79]|uniref:Uncharacterized protein n=1 Tax=Aspergillus ellipticus CBS 707.79 TaxID=1448320 RepID=A0A319D977_9EURO|nr:hypothetical protein BO71DRAFT_430518 [Aspergillus ellipticus CBS 707.79]